MPYKIKKIGKKGYKVCKKYEKKKCFSKKPLPKKRAIAQMTAITINEFKINLVSIIKESLNEL
jgi:hypothetical protein